MANVKKEIKKSEEADTPNVLPNHPEWTDHVLSLLSEDEKIAGNPTTDGLRRIFETALNCVVISSKTTIIQSPDISNEKRATAQHELVYKLLDPNAIEPDLLRSVSGAADVYWGNCDKIYRNHPVAVAETRAEGRALRRALRLRKVVAAEEIAKEIEDDVNGNTVSKITNNQINFMDVIAKRIDVNVLEVAKSLSIKLENNNIYSIKHEDAVAIITKLTEMQRDILNIDSILKGYDTNWK